MNKFTREQKITFLIDCLGYSKDDFDDKQMSYINELIKENSQDFLEYYKK